MGKPTICICQNKGADQLRVNGEADQRLCFRYSDSTIPLLSKFPVSSHLLCLYSPICVGPVRKPHCWFSHEAAHLLLCVCVWALFDKKVTFMIRRCVADAVLAAYQKH